MISQKRILAARTNGALSRGPKTPEGKARSRNAVRSRRLTDGVVLGQESREAFQELFNFHVDCFSPLDDVEMGMVEEMASAYWRLRRNSPTYVVMRRASMSCTSAPSTTS